VEKWDNSRSGFPAITSPHTFHSSSGSLAMLAAMRRASFPGQEVRRCPTSRLVLEIAIRREPARCDRAHGKAANGTGPPTEAASFDFFF